ncbi:MAG: hypothetical protein ACI9GM_001429 [Salibacteraceae bacterium]|jgi:hypothetical protein
MMSIRLLSCSSYKVVSRNFSLFVIVLWYLPITTIAQDDILIPFRNRDLWYYVNEQGERNSDNNYEEATPFIENYAAVRIENKFGFIDRNEQIVISPQYDFAQSTYFGFFVANGVDSFLINLNNHRIPDGICGTIGGSRSMTLKVVFENNGKQGVLNEIRDTIIPPKYSKVEVIDYSEVIVVYNEKCEIALFNKEGKKVLSPSQLDSVGNYKNGTVPIYLRGKIGAVNVFGDLMAYPRYNNLDFTYFNMPFTRLGKGRKGYVYNGNEYWKQHRCLFRK